MLTIWFLAKLNILLSQVKVNFYCFSVHDPYFSMSYFGQIFTWTTQKCNIIMNQPALQVWNWLLKINTYSAECFRKILLNLFVEWEWLLNSQVFNGMTFNMQLGNKFGELATFISSMLWPDDTRQYGRVAWQMWSPGGYSGRHGDLATV